MAFTFPDDARPWGQPHLDIEVDGEVLRQFIFRDPGTRMGRTFYTTDSRRIFLIAPAYKEAPLRIQVDGEFVRCPRKAILIWDVAAHAVETLRANDGIHDALESEPDGEES